jgi:hypothetical protein
MKAEEARKLAISSMKEVVIQPFLIQLHARITEEAKKGRRGITHPFSGFLKYPSLEEQEAIDAALRADGYSVVDHPNPDPGDPRSSSYTSISW